jgi:hypothetical protein
MGFKVLFRRKRTKPTVTPATTRPPQPTDAPAPAAAVDDDEDAAHDPPPYSPPPTATTGPAEGGQSGVLDPSLRLTASQVEQRWQEKDRLFARVVVQFIAERFDGNLRGWAGYKYTYINAVRPLVLVLLILVFCEGLT